MKSELFKPSLFVKEKRDLPLSGHALNELLQAVLARGVSLRFRAKGFSMSPFVRHMDIITISPLSGRSLRPGDIVAFIHPQAKKLCVHRIIKKEGNSFKIKGDNVPGFDDLVPLGSVVGFVTRVEREGRRVFLGLGPERFLIAFFSSNNFLKSFLDPITRLFFGIQKGPFPSQKSYISFLPMKKFPLWNKIKGKTKLLSIDLEITARCNNNCRHCYINLPEGDKAAREKELSLQEIEEIADEARSLGALECLITGGEPLLREDFFDIYLCLKKMGLLVSVFTNATLITREHARFFKQYPPRDMEVSVYGVTDVTYERITRRKGSFSAFQRGLGLLLDSGVKVRLKAMALRSNAHELQNMARFCRQKTKDYYRFDPLLHLRYDRNPQRNTEIRGERLSAEEIVALERSDPERFRALEKNCDNLIFPKNSHSGCNHLFLCGAGTLNCVIGYDGQFRLCYSLWHPDCIYDLRAGSLRDAFLNLVPNVRDLQSSRKEYHDKCRVCPIINLCLWCPAHALLETGEMDTPVDYFCEVAHARADMLKKA